MRDYLDDDDDDSNDSDKSETSKNETCKSIHTAMGMVKWTMTHNVWLSTTFKIECILGWGGCGVVLGATRRSNNKERTYDSSPPFDTPSCGIGSMTGMLTRYLPQRPSMAREIPKKNKNQAQVPKKAFQDHSKKRLYLPKTQERHSQTTVTELRKYQNSLAKYVSFQISPVRVNYMHSQWGLVHGDIKEENILVGVEAATLECILKAL
ncbi:hypothetical protein BASA60_005610 [Batrachochytrium salamandrivorans]|nr:hypothetical protein BASA60_005610 [Batrachochytrium salamandrivorans]